MNILNQPKGQYNSKGLLAMQCEVTSTLNNKEGNFTH